MILYDRPFLTLHWDPDANIVCAQWKGDVGGDDVRAGLEEGLRFIAEKKARKWLVDGRDFGTIDPGDVKWVNDVWVPRAVDAGIAWMGFVMARKIVMAMTMKSFIARINQRELGTAYFDDLDSAREWLRAQP